MSEKDNLRVSIPEKLSNFVLVAKDGIKYKFIDCDAEIVKSEVDGLAYVILSDHSCCGYGKYAKQREVYRLRCVFE